MRFPSLRLLAVVLPFFASGCADDSAQVAPWQGSWRAIETYMRGQAFEPVAVAIQEQRPGYTVQEIQDLFAGFHDVDFTDLTVDGTELTFEADGTVVCAGRYRSTGHVHHDGDHEEEEEHDHGEGVELELTRTLDGSCDADFEHVAIDSLPIEALHDGEILAHFHLKAGAERPQPWSPGVIEPIEDGVFTAMQLENVDNYVAALPER